MSRLELIVDNGLTLRQFIPEDAGVIFELIDTNRGHLSQNGDDTAKKYKTEKEVLDSILHPKNQARQRFGIWSIDAYVGTINVTPEDDKAEMGYYLGAQHQGHGYMGRAVHRIVNYCFDDLRLQKIWAKVHVNNEKSTSVLFASGFRVNEDKPSDDCIYFSLQRLDEEPLKKLIDAPIDQDGLMDSFYKMIKILNRSSKHPQYHRLLEHVYNRITRVFDTDDGGATLFYRADYMLALLGRAITKVKIPEESFAVIKKKFYDMKARNNCQKILPYEEIFQK